MTHKSFVQIMKQKLKYTNDTERTIQAKHESFQRAIPFLSDQARLGCRCRRDWGTVYAPSLWMIKLETGGNETG